MREGKFRSLAVLGGLVVGAAVLAGCGTAAERAAGPGATTTTTTAPAPTTTGPTPATTAPASDTGPSGGGPVLIVRAFGASAGYDGRKPSTIAFSRDSSNIVQHLTWSSWGPTTAAGHGTVALDNCQPNCAQGSVTQVAATVDLSSVVGGHFTAMSERAGGFSRTYSYPSDWATSAS